MDHELTDETITRRIKVLDNEIIELTRDFASTSDELHLSIEELEHTNSALDEHAIVSITNTKGIITYANSKFCDISGYTKEELEGSNHRIINSGYHPPEFFKEMWGTISNGKTWHGEIRNRKKDGSLYWLMATVVPSFDNNGKIYQYIAIRTDVTARKRIEEALFKSEETLSAHIENSPLGFIAWNTDFVCTQWNPASEKIFGWKKTEVIGKHASEFIIPDEYLDQVVDVWFNLLNQTGGNRSVNENHTKIGEAIWCEWFNTTLTNHDGKTIGVASMVRNITKEKAADEALFQAKIIAENANRAKTEFLAKMSHELRSPLNAILGFSSIVKDGHITDLNKINEYMGYIHDSGNTLLELIENLLDTAKSELGKSEISEEKCFLAKDIIKPIIDMLTPRMEDKGLKFIQYMSCDDVVYGDKIKLKQVITNILTNAIKYSDTGTISLSSKCNENGIRISIKDQGIGMSDEDLKRIFEPFFRVEASKHVSGTGIGLTIIKDIVEMHGGKIVVHSALGIGTEFIVKLPFTRIVKKVIDSTL